MIQMFYMFQHAPGVIKFDLSASVVVQFKDNLPLFFDDVLKMAKLMQPSMLYIDGAHNPFIKKVYLYITYY